MSKTAIAIVFGYMLGLVVTFGHVYAHSDSVFTGDDGKKYEKGTSFVALGALLGSTAWPLYWSVRIWEAP